MDSLVCLLHCFLIGNDGLHVFSLNDFINDKSTRSHLCSSLASEVIMNKLKLLLFYPFCSYLSALISQSFLDIGSVSRILDGIMKLCLQFCWMIESQENNESTAELEHVAEVGFN